MPFIRDAALDAKLLDIADTGNRLDICTAEPTTYTAATSTLTLANQTLAAGVAGADYAVADRTGGGRELTVSAQSIASGNVTGSGTPAGWAITDGVGVLLATGTMTGPNTTAGFAYDLTAFTLGAPDAVAA